jgi:hypothetical protein
MSDPSSIYLVLTNVAFLFAFAYAIEKKLWPESTIILVVALASSFYHLCQTEVYCAAEYPYSGLPRYLYLQQLDEFMVATTVIWFIMYFFEIPLALRACFVFFVQGVVFVPIISQSYEFVYIGVSFLVVAFVALMIMLYFRKYIHLSIYSTIAAALLIGVGVALFVIGGDPDDSTYTWFHGTWHLLLFFGVFFVIDIKYGVTDRNIKASLPMAHIQTSIKKPPPMKYVDQVTR